MAALPEDFRRNAVLIVDAGPAEINDAVVRELLHSLRRHCMALAMHFDLVGGGWRRALGYDIAVIGCGLPERGAFDGDVREKIAGLMDATQATRQRTAITGVEKPSWIRTLRELGVGLAGGPAVAPARDAPVPAQFYSTEDFAGRTPLK